MRPSPQKTTPSTSGRIAGLLAGFLASLVALDGASAQERSRFALDTAFTYQGRLQDGGLPAEGRFDLSFELFDAPSGGTSLGQVDRFDVPIRQGAFAAELDFGFSVHAGDPLWLEIQVRPAGDGAYTPLDPRHRLAGEGVSTCVVDSDVLINGRLDINPGSAGTALGIPCCDEATLAGGGRIELAGFLQSLGIDNNEIQSRGLGGGAPFWINPEGGFVGLGVSGTPGAPLQMVGTPDAEPNGGGALVVGFFGGLNVAVDNNEIMARNNGQTSTLYLNNDGGDVVIGGHLDLGLSRIHAGSNDLETLQVHCPGGTYLVSGGCASLHAIEHSYPIDSNTWQCRFDGAGGSAYAVCARIRW